MSRVSIFAVSNIFCSASYKGSKKASVSTQFTKGGTRRALCFPFSGLLCDLTTKILWNTTPSTKLDGTLRFTLFFKYAR